MREEEMRLKEERARAVLLRLRRERRGLLTSEVEGLLRETEKDGSLTGSEACRLMSLADNARDRAMFDAGLTIYSGWPKLPSEEAIEVAESALGITWSEGDAKWRMFGRHPHWAYVRFIADIVVRNDAGVKEATERYERVVREEGLKGHEAFAVRMRLRDLDESISRCQGVLDRYVKRRRSAGDGGTGREDNRTSLKARLESARERLDSLMLLRPEEERALADDFLARVAEVRSRRG